MSWCVLRTELGAKERLLALDSDEKRLDYIQEEIEEAWDEDHLLQTDKAWDAIHRCLTDGTLSVARSSTPLGKLILGGIQLYSDPQSYIVNFTDSSELPEISIALKAITKEWLKARYEQLRGTDYPQESSRSKAGSTRGTGFRAFQVSLTAPLRKALAWSSRLTSRGTGRNLSDFPNLPGT